LESGFAVVFVELPVQVRQTIRPPDEWFQLCPLFEEFERNREANNRDGADTNGYADGQTALGSLRFIALWLILGLVVGAVLAGGLMVTRQRRWPGSAHQALPSTELIATGAATEDAAADSELQQQGEETEEKHGRATLFNSLQK
jgi:hypothetical protein